MIEMMEALSGSSVEDYAAPLFIAWQINSECNLNCLHCCEEAGLVFPGEMNKDQRLDFCRQCVDAKIPYVAISGGEPLMCPDFWDVAELLRSNGVVLKVETNGEMIDSDSAKRLGSLEFRSVQISLDGATQKAHEALREKGDWKKVIQACELVRKENVNIEIVFVPTLFNVHEVGDAVDLAASLGATGFYTGKIMRIGRAAHNWEKLCPSDEQYEQFFETLQEKGDKYKGRMKVYFYPYDVVQELKYRLESPSASLLVIPNGKVKLIGPLPFICGDLKTSTLLDVWDSYRKAWKDERVIEFSHKVFDDHNLLAESNNWVELY